MGAEVQLWPMGDQLVKQIPVVCRRTRKSPRPRTKALGWPFYWTVTAQAPRRRENLKNRFFRAKKLHDCPHGDGILSGTFCRRCLSISSEQDRRCGNVLTINRDQVAVGRAVGMWELARRLAARINSSCRAPNNWVFLAEEGCSQVGYRGTNDSPTVFESRRMFATEHAP